jgi:flagellar L-ring protein precursor FlgH
MPKHSSKIQKAGRAARHVVFWAGVTIVPREALAQDSSLLLAPPAPQPGQLTLDNSSFIYRKLPPEAEQRELKENDIITVLVDVRSTMLSEGEAENRRTANLNAVLADWLKFDGKDLIPAPQSNGDPRVNGSVTSQFRAESDIELRDALTFRIAARVVDIQPNGNLVIEARREITINEEVWLHSLTGIVRRQSIGPDRTVRSDDIADLHIDKREKGFVRDGYRRGWWCRWYDKWKPF